MPSLVQWINHLESKIIKQKAYAASYEARYENSHVLPFIANEYRQTFGAPADNLAATLLAAPRVGMAATVVDALVERLIVTGGTSTDRATSEAFDEAWEANDLDVMHREAHREAFVSGRSFGAVTRSVTDESKSILTIESATQAAVHRAQAPPYDVDAYMKIWTDEWTGKRRGLLQMPDVDYELIEGSKVWTDPTSNTSTRWAISKETDRPGPVRVVEFAHRPRLLKEPSSEIERLSSLIDQGDLIEGLMVFAGYFGAVPIRWATGLEVPRDPRDPTKPLIGKDGKPVIGFDAKADSLWVSTNKDARFGQMVPASLDTFVQWAEHVTAGLRRLSSVASTYFSLDIKSHMSAELLKTDEAPMVRRINGIGRNGVFNQSWRRAMQHMMEVEGHQGVVKPQWIDPQTRMEAQAVDSFQKAVTSGLGVKIAAEQFLGWSPELAERAVAEHRAEQDAILGGDGFALLDPATRAALKGLPSGNAGLPASA